MKKLKLSTLALEADVISSIDGLRKVIGGDGEYGSLPTTQAGFDYAFVYGQIPASSYAVNLGPVSGGGGSSSPVSVGYNNGSLTASANVGNANFSVSYNGINPTANNNPNNSGAVNGLGNDYGAGVDFTIGH